MNSARNAMVRRIRRLRIFVVLTMTLCSFLVGMQIRLFNEAELGQLQIEFYAGMRLVPLTAPQWNVTNHNYQVMHRLRVPDQNITHATMKDRIQQHTLAKPQMPSIDLIQRRNDSADGYESFSACLLVMDDNHRLAEWLAYHYWILPLRYVIVAVDPHSRTSPTLLVDSWRALGMIITEWSDPDFLDPDKSLLRGEMDDPNMKRNKHKERQTKFYKRCTEHLMKQNRTWTTYHDIDEFISFNFEQVPDHELRLSRPGAVLQFLREIRQNTTHQSLWQVRHFQEPKCITLPRSLYSAVNSTMEEIYRSVPDWVDPLQFDTLRWRYRSNARGTRDGNAKSIMDVSKITPSDLQSGGNAHKPLKDPCPNIGIPYQLPLGIHHYLGSFESYAFRDDARRGTIRSREIWQERSTRQEGGPDDEARCWIQGFVYQVGVEQAQVLLANAGLPPSYRMSANVTATWASIQKKTTGNIFSNLDPFFSNLLAAWI